MPLPQALSLVPQAKLFLFNPIQEEKLLQRLARWAYSFSPLVYFDRSDYHAHLLDIRLVGISLELTGLNRLYGGEVNLLARIWDDLKRFSLNARCAVASTYNAAWALARYNTQTTFAPLVTTTTSQEKELLTLPIAALRLAPDEEASLNEVQINYVKDLVRIPSTQLLSRFGPQLSAKLAALFSDSIPPAAFCTNQPKQAQIILETPLENKQIIERHCHVLLNTILNKKVAPYCALSKLELSLGLLPNQHISELITLSVPSRQKTHLLSLIHLCLKNIKLGSAVEKITLTVKQETILASAETNFFAKTQDTASKGQQLLDILATSLSPQCIYRLQMRSSHFPERAINYESIASPQSFASGRIAKLLRPSLLFDRAKEIEAISLLPDYPPHLLTWNGARYKVTSALGPERLTAEWWATSATTATAGERDYFSLRLESGLWVWVYRENQTLRWFLQGVWA